jgi:exopolyphosphatase / guanosine-5'-triphosphate,3'-diphosphate pyrophosphatase
MPEFIKRAQNIEALAAIDLGSNALRAIIAHQTGNKLEIIRNIREPLRLGEDVFGNGEISAEKMDSTEEAFIKLFHIFMEYNVKEVKALATSAMRDAKNSAELSKRIIHSTGIDIQTIDGKKEAELIFAAVKSQINLKKKSALIMDIGGGSTELIAVQDEIIVGIHSFNVGTVRLLRYKNQEDLDIRIRLQMGKMLRFIKHHLGKKPDLFIGTGGNLRRIGKIRKKLLRKDTSQLATFEEIHHMEQAILSMSFVDRIRRLELDQNRADVILPAIMLTHHLMEEMKIGKIILPKVGLKEGIILSMLSETPTEMILKD